MNIRTITINDYPNLIPFWKTNYFVKEMDSETQFSLFLEKNPNLSVLMEDNNKIIGTALGSFDGRRGYIQKVVTAKNIRKKGVGKQLVHEVINRLKLLGVLYIPIQCDLENVSFYEKCGFQKSTMVPMTMNVK
jgi:ribosomal protein S18 acetylase RimI-like enzyme